MSEEEILTKYIELINKGYCCACNELNCIDNFPHKKIANAISNLQQENTKLKKELEITTFNFQSLSSACGSLAEFMGLDKDAIIEEMIDKVVKDRKEKDLYKSVLKEIREYVDNKLTDYNLRYGITNEFRCEWDDLLEIIDKGLKNDE